MKLLNIQTYKSNIKIIILMGILKSAIKSMIIIDISGYLWNLHLFQ